MIQLRLVDSRKPNPIPSAGKEGGRKLCGGGRPFCRVPFVGRCCSARLRRAPRRNEIQLPIFQTVLNGTKIVGSIVGTRVDLREVFELHAAGKTKVVCERRRLEDVNQAIDEVLSGRVTARLVFDLG